MKYSKISTLLMAFVITLNLSQAQQKQNQMSNTKIVTTFLEGFNDSEKIGKSLSLLADDYQFSNPLVSLNSKVEFLQLAEQVGAVLTGVKVIRIAESGKWVAAYYEFTSEIPGVESNLATEWFRVENGMIKESQLIYDASEWRKVYARMEN